MSKRAKVPVVSVRVEFNKGERFWNDPATVRLDGKLRARIYWTPAGLVIKRRSA